MPLRSSIGNSTSIITEKDDLSSENAKKKVEKISISRKSIDVDADLADFPSIDKWFDALTDEELRELIDNDYTVEDISEENDCLLDIKKKQVPFGYLLFLELLAGLAPLAARPAPMLLTSAFAIGERMVNVS